MGILPWLCRDIKKDAFLATYLFDLKRKTHSLLKGRLPPFGKFFLLRQDSVHLLERWVIFSVKMRPSSLEKVKNTGTLFCRT